MATLDAQIEAIIPQLIAAYPPGGVVCRLQLARLPAGVSIDPHYDSSDLLRLCHRVHLPLITEPGVAFTIADETHHFRVGQALEVNNRVVHGVQHNGEHFERVYRRIFLPPCPHRSLITSVGGKADVSRSCSHSQNFCPKLALNF